MDDEKREELRQRAGRLFSKPRDPARIQRIIAKLEEAWRTHPDMRLAQLLVALSTTAPNPLFNIEDEMIERRLDDLLQRGVWPKADTN